MQRDYRHFFHQEMAIDGFSSIDGTIRFYSFVRAAKLRTGAREILDFGAGRGALAYDETSVYRRVVADLRGPGTSVTACDVDEVVLSNSISDSQIVIKPGDPLPFNEGKFEVILSDMTFEHIEDSTFVAGELFRVLKPGGIICVRTPNRLGYVRLLTSLIPNRLHRAALNYIQPHRRPGDVFPTFYRMNSPKQIARLFPECEVISYYDSAEPAYYFGSRFLYGLILFLHWLLPPIFATTVCLFVLKAEKPRSSEYSN